MSKYSDCLEKVKSAIECRYNGFGTPIAYNIHNEEEYSLVLECENLGHMSCCDPKEHYNYDYKGKDWYFFESKSEDYGMDGKRYIYYQETLSEKKEKFKKYCEIFDNEQCDFCKPKSAIATTYGKIWIDKSDKLGNFKWTSDHCPPYAECAGKDMNIVNTTTIKYCPICGKELNH